MDNERIPVWPIILLFLTSTDTVLFGTNGNRIFLYIPRMMGLGMCLLIPLILKNRYLKNYRALFVTLVLIVITIISSVVNGQNIYGLVSRVIPILVAYTIIENYDFRYFAVAFDKVLYLLALTSLIMYMINAFSPSIVSKLPRIVNENGTVFYSAGIVAVSQEQLSRGVFGRMSSIIWEPGAYSIYLCIGIMYQLFYFEKICFKKVYIYCFALLVTFSTTGYIGFALIMIAYILNNRDTSNKNWKYIIIGGLIVFCAGVLLSEDSAIFEFVFGKITGQARTSIVRLSSFVNGFQIALDHPILGVGGRAGAFMPLYSYKMGWGENKMLTNTFVSQFANYGFIFGVLFMLGTFKNFIRNDYYKCAINPISKILLYGSILAMYCGECFYSFLPFVFVMYGFKNFSNEELYNEDCWN